MSRVDFWETDVGKFGLGSAAGLVRGACVARILQASAAVQYDRKLGTSEPASELALRLQLRLSARAAQATLHWCSASKAAGLCATGDARRRLTSS
jgi:hypothetical protein